MNTQSTDCTFAAAALPWYLNGTLDAVESRRLEAHLETCLRCRQEHRDVAFAAAVYAAHPPAEDLVDFAFHRLALSSRRGVVERHLKVCLACAEEVRLVETSRDALAELEAAGADEPPRTPSQSIPIVREFRPRKAGTDSWWRSAALAASLAAILGAGFWLWNLGPRSADLADGSEGQVSGGRVPERSGSEDARASIGLSLPKLPSQNPSGVGASLVSIQPGTLTVSTDVGTAATLELPREAQEVRVTLRLQDFAENGLLELQVLDASDRVVWRGGALQATDSGLFTATLPLEFLPQGAGSLRLRQRNGDRIETLATLPIKLIRS